MKTKIILRFVVTIVILGLLFLGAWLIWFKPTNELEVFNTLTKLQNTDSTEKGLGGFEYVLYGTDKDSKGIGLFNDGSNKYYKNMSNFSATNTNVNEMGNRYYRLFMFGENGTADTTKPYGALILNGGSNISLTSMYAEVDKAFDYYYAYVQLANKVEKDDVKQIKKLTNDLNSSYNTFTSLKVDLDALLTKKGGENVDNATIDDEVTNLFKSLFNEYFNIVKKYNVLTMQVRDFVVKYVFDNNFAYSTESVYYEVVLNSVNEFTKTSTDILVVEDSKTSVKTDSQYIDLSADICRVINSGKKEVVEQYVKLNSNYKEALTGAKSIFALSHSDKVKFAKNGKTVGEEVIDGSEVIAKYNSDYYEEIKSILEAYYVG